MDEASVPPGWPGRTLLLVEKRGSPGDFDTSIAAGLREHGCRVEYLPKSEPWSGPVDLVIGFGPQRGGLLPVASRLAALPPPQRPVFVWWLTEGVPDARLPIPLVRAAAALRVALDGRLAFGSPGFDSFAPRYLGRLLARGHRLRILGELTRARTLGVLDVLAVSSASRAAYLRRCGLHPVVVPLGYHPVYGRDLGLARDVDVAFLGSLDSWRRRSILRRVATRLRRRGVEVSVQTALYGNLRTHFLNRAKITLNLLRAPHDWAGQRFLLGAANKTLVVSEPIRDAEPFVAGRHLVVAPVDRLAEAVEYYLSHPAERDRIVEEAHALATVELTTGRMVGRILDTARDIHASRADSGRAVAARGAGSRKSA